MANWRQATETSASNEAQCALLAGNHLACRRLISPSAAEMTDKRNSFPGCFIEAVSRLNKIISGIGCLAVNSLDSLFQPLGMPNPATRKLRRWQLKSCVPLSAVPPSPPSSVIASCFWKLLCYKSTRPLRGNKVNKKTNTRGERHHLLSCSSGENGI